MIKITVHFENNSRELLFPGSVTLLEAVRCAGAALYAPCGGEGRCGGCRVKAAGALSEPDELERERLGDLISGGVRLACRARAVGDAEVFVGEGDRSVYAAEASIVHAPAEPTGKFGVALDIGTTTVEASLVDLLTGERVRTSSASNPQSVWGADVISRISAVSEGKTYVSEMSSLVRGCADMLRGKLGADGRVPCVAVGNTVMMSLFACVDPSPIGRAPFVPRELFGGYITSGENIFLPRCVSGFFGSDAIAAVIAVMYGGSEAADGGFILCDFGTNGEVAVYDGEALHVCSAAAGPALEGAGISCGMRAEAGAIDSVTINAGEVRCHVIGGGVARGVCGSGLIDAAACMLALGAIDRGGTLAEPFRLTDTVVITQDDIRALMLAKAAIRAALDIASEDVPRALPLYVSGGFAAGLSARSCARIGLIPQELAGDVRFIGNGALRGAELMLTRPELREAEAKLAADAVYTELSGSPRFERQFLRSLEF